jgi:hypothetical protein
MLQKHACRHNQNNQIENFYREIVAQIVIKYFYKIQVKNATTNYSHRL